MGLVWNVNQNALHNMDVMYILDGTDDSILCVWVMQSKMQRMQIKTTDFMACAIFSSQWILRAECDAIQFLWFESK